MSRPSFFDCPASQLTLGVTQLSSLLDFLIRNQNLLLSDGEIQSRFKAKTPTSTPLSHIFGKAAELGAERLFALASAGRSRSVSISETLDRSYLTFDIRQMNSVSPALGVAAQHIPSLDGKIILNITRMERKSGEMTDIPEFQNSVVRDLLSRSFYSDRRPIWLTPNITQFVCKVYSMSLASTVARWYSLDMPMQTCIAIVFAYFFLSQMSRPDIAKTILKSRGRYFLFNDMATIDQILNVCDEACGGAPLDLEGVAAAIASFAPQRVDVGRSRLYSGLQNLGPDYHTTAIALEYPPYFLYLILRALSGIKNGLSTRLKDMKIASEGTSMAGELATTPMFLQALLH